jgi:hypothetical protein
MFSHSAYLTPASSDQPESIALGFLSRNRELFRFSDEDLANLKLKSRAYVPDIGTTILLFGQQANGLPVYHGEVLVNVNRSGQIISVGGESFPQLRVINALTLTPEQAITAAASAIGINNFNPQSIGTKQTLTTFGNIPPQFAQAPAFSGGGIFADKIIVTQTVFPLGEVGRLAYKFVLTTPQYEGIMWENIVDAQTGQVLRRISLTASFGPRGGGQGVGRLATFRPDVQDRVEAMNPSGSAQGKVFDGMPTALSGYRGFGRTNTPGTPPGYAPDSTTTGNGVGFRESLVMLRNQNPLVYGGGFGHVTRGFPDRQPSAESPFGWFYLPPIAAALKLQPNSNRAATRGFGYAMAAEAQGRNVAANSGCRQEPALLGIADALVSAITLADGRTLASVYQSNYTEGNNVIAADDHEDDNEATHGIKGYSLGRQFNASYFDFINAYEFGNVNAGGTPFFPPSSFPDVSPGALTLFYYNNVIHDYLYSIGFTEGLWNFQQDNFGKGGAGQDAVSLQVQDGSGTNNANGLTDGGPPHADVPPRELVQRSDGDFDFDIVAHELFTASRIAAQRRNGGLGLALVGESGGQEKDGRITMQIDGRRRRDRRYATGRLITERPRRTIDGPTGGEREVPTVDGQPPDVAALLLKLTEENCGATLWDARVVIVKARNGTSLTARRLGGGSGFIGSRLVHSVDAPIDYAQLSIPGSRQPSTPAAHCASWTGRSRIAQHGIETPSTKQGAAGFGHAGVVECSFRRRPSFVDSLIRSYADRELTGGENQHHLRAFASHGGYQAASTSGLADYIATQLLRSSSKIPACPPPSRVRGARAARRAAVHSLKPPQEHRDHQHQ